MTGVPKLAASMMPLELFPIITAASRISLMNSSLAMFARTSIRESDLNPRQQRTIPAAPGSLLGSTITILSNGIDRVAPERVFGEWGHSDAELTAIRDYFQVETEAGERFWLFREGDGEDPATGSRRWFLHGIFA